MDGNGVLFLVLSIGGCQFEMVIQSLDFCFDWGDEYGRDKVGVYGIE